jgi:hypothetical protein
MPNRAPHGSNSRKDILERVDIPDAKEVAHPVFGNGTSASSKVQGRQTHSQREKEGPHFTGPATDPRIVSN